MVEDFCKLVLYLTFFCVLCMFYGMPIHIIRDVALTIRSFYKRITDFLRYRHATRDMNEKYPDATSAEIGSGDVCIICREQMRAWQAPVAQGTANAEGVAPAGSRPVAVDERLRPKKLPCGHILHFSCLRSWLERQQNCPTCRQPVLTSTSEVPSVNPRAFDRQAQAQGQMNAGENGGQIQAPGAGANRIRIFNLGPFRLGFGAGQDIQGLAQQLNNQPVQQPQQPHELQANRIVQQVGLGMRFGRHPVNVTHQQMGSSGDPQSVPIQLQSIEQQLMHDINELRLQADELTLVRALQGELARLRIARSYPSTAQTGSVPHGSQSRHLVPSWTPVPAVALPPGPAIQTFSANGVQARLDAGRPDLPPGLTLPDGWTMLPLQRIATNLPMAGPSSTSPLNSSTWSHSNTGAAAPSDTIPVLSNNSVGAGQQRVAEPSVALPIPNVWSSIPHARSVSQTPSSSPARLHDRPAESGPVSGGRPNRPGDADTEPSVEGKSSTADRPAAAYDAMDAASDSIPRWGSGVVGNNDDLGLEGGAPSSDTPGVLDPDQIEIRAAADRRAAKGKGRATTVEDASEEND